MQLDDADLKTLQSKATTVLRRYVDAAGDSKDLREVATYFVHGRRHFFTKDGEPDWRGVTHTYRQWIRETYALAGVPRDRLSSLQAAVRYHVGSVLREVVGPDVLADLGLLNQSPRERSAERHASTYDLASLFGSGGRITDGTQIADAVRAMTTTLRRIDLPAAISDEEILPEQFDRRIRDLRRAVDELAIEYRAARQERNAAVHARTPPRAEVQRRIQLVKSLAEVQTAGEKRGWDEQALRNLVEVTQAVEDTVLVDAE